MILSDGTDTREEVRSSGPYCDGMAVVLDRLYLNGDAGDEMTSHPVLSEGVARYGRRLFFWDDRGFMGTSRYQTEAAAGEAFAILANDYDDE